MCYVVFLNSSQRHVKHIITVFTYTTGDQDTFLAQIFLKSHWKHVENSSGKVTLFTHLLIFFSLCNLNLFAIALSFFSFLSPTIVFRTSSILPFLSLRWWNTQIPWTAWWTTSKVFPPADASVSQPFQETHTHTCTHTHIVAFPLPSPQSPTLCQQTCRDHDVIISPIAWPYACECVAVYRKILSGGFHGTSELTTVSTLVHVCIIGIKMSGFLILLFVAKQTAILIHFLGE